MYVFFYYHTKYTFVSCKFFLKLLMLQAKKFPDLDALEVISNLEQFTGHGAWTLLMK